MPADVQIAFRGMEPSPSVEARVQRRAEDLQQLSDRVTACRVTLEAAHRRHRQGTIYHVSIDLAVPGGKIVVNREPGEDHAHEDMHVAVRDAFDAARRQLQDHVRRLDGQTKQHPAPSIGRIARVFAERDHAFLETADGEETYLSRNAAIGGGFDRLKSATVCGQVVDLDEGDNGPQDTLYRSTPPNKVPNCRAR